MTNLLERGIIEYIGPYGLSNTLFSSGKNISKLDTGIVTSYALYIVLGLISLIFININNFFYIYFFTHYLKTLSQIPNRTKPRSSVLIKKK